MALTFRKLVQVDLMKMFFGRGFSAFYVISGITENFIKVNCLNSVLGKKILVIKCFVSDSFRCIFLLDWLFICKLLYIKLIMKEM